MELIKNKIVSINKTIELANFYKKEGKKILTTNGSFDLIHSAHVRLFEKIKTLYPNSCLIVLVNSNDSVKRFKGEPRPYNDEKDRARVLAGHKDIDFVVVFPQDKPLEYLEMIKPNVHIKGGTYDEVRMGEEKKFVESWGGEYCVLELEGGYSSTNIAKKIAENASQELGR